MVGRFTSMLVLAGLLGAQASVFAAPPQPIATNKTRFRIPFKVDPAALQRLNARELQLHVSKDGGVTWDLAQALAPDGAKFEYQAAGDGDYWFAVKTVDGRNQVHPPIGQYETGLIVQVDTLPPLLDLSLQQQAAGKVQLTWNAADAHLDLSTLKIEYLQPGSQDWETVDVTPKASGQISWNVPEQGQVRVRGVINDMAANVGRGQSQVQVIAVGDPVPKPKPGRRVPIAELEEGQDQASSDAATGQSQAGLSKAPRGASEDFRGPVITPFGMPALPATPSDRFVTDKANLRPDITKGRWGDEAGPTERFSAERSPASQEPVAQNPTPQNAAAPKSSSPLRIVGSRKFQIGYTVDDVGPSGVGAVDLFITQDMGRKWWKYGEDSDRRSPFDVEVPQDGEYGFAIRVRSGVGLANDPPLPGEAPSIVVGVDQTPPTVELVSAQQGKGAYSNRILVRWRVADEHLASKPVAIYSAPSRNGPWEAVAGWTDDQGSFEWTVMPGSPSQFYVRVVARDVAGNTAKADSPQPILVDLVRPNARIVDVEAPQSGPK